ncbi:MAG: ABC transporter permease [Chloroflexi bacterium]|nr:ABC transporter permease [Chloroflexota bacterium]
MTTEVLTPKGVAQPRVSIRIPESLTRVLKYLLFRGIALFVTVVIGVYLTVLIANMGGYLDTIRMAVIQEEVGAGIMNDPTLRGLPASEVRRVMDERIIIAVKQLNLDQPFALRSVNYLTDALTLNLGRAEFISSDSGSRRVQAILVERMPATLLLFATSNLFLFFAAVFIALFLSRHYGSWLDRIVIAMAPTSAVPAWLYGIFLILLFASIAHVLPFGGLVDAPVPETLPEYAASLLRHMILPLSALALHSIFISIYHWRTFFLIYSSEDYVDMAKAKGLSSRTIERQYILRPTLPPIVTSFAFTLVYLWQGAIILETVFAWPGLGRLLYQAINLFDVPVIVGNTVLIAYLLVASVFLLDIIYALLDPRVKVGGGEQRA